MKKLYSILCCAALTSAAIAQQPAVATFEDLNAQPNTYWDGSDESAMFTSGGYTFINNFTDWGGYTSWDGFAYSTMTSTKYETLTDQYNSCVGHGVSDSKTYGVAYYSAYMGTEPTVIAATAETFDATGCYVTNAAYAYTSMANGDAYSKKFDATDWFLLTATGYKADAVTATAEFYLAKDGGIVNDWQYFDLTALGQVDEIHFTLTSSDTGDWGMNTPAYFCIDNFGAVNPTVGLKAIKALSDDACGYDLMGRRVKGARGLVIR